MADELRLEIDADGDAVRSLRFTGDDEPTWQEQMVIDAVRLKIHESGTAGTWSDDGQRFVAT